MKTVLLWSHQWWLPGREPVAFASLAEAAAVLAASWSETSRDIRLIYEPAGFASVSTDCPNASRATLALALREQLPSLDQAGLAWSHEPILASADHFQTILHHEAEPALQELVENLVAVGFRVLTAYPFPTWLNALPDEVSETGGVCVAGLAPTQVCMYRHAPDGVRTVERWSGPAALGEFGHYLRGLFSDHPQETILLVTTSATVLEPINAIVPLEGRDGVQFLPLMEALLRQAVIPARHPARLLPPATAPRINHIMVAASIAFLLAAAVLTASFFRDHALARKNAVARETQLTTLRTEVAHRRANAAEIETLRRRTDQPGGVQAGRLLDAITATLPRDLVLADVELTPGHLRMRGWMAPATKTIEPWLTELRRSLPGWQFTSPPPAASGFELNGFLP